MAQAKNMQKRFTLKGKSKLARFYSIQDLRVSSQFPLLFIMNCAVGNWFQSNLKYSRFDLKMNNYFDGIGIFPITTLLQAILSFVSFYFSR